MRAGICSIPQSLTADAATVVKQAITLARRRGHAQVTPLHVASAMLASSTGLLRRSCLQSHSHPLQCKALELCFNVALNRLPASTSSPLLGGPQTPHPSLSNALVAAFKRAQAHQRRGSVENQQQPILALKIEIEQLIISILDDPSVSRVMREAGFSSTQVKNRVEQAVSLEICAQAPKSSVSNNNNHPKENSMAPKPLLLGSNNMSLSLRPGQVELDPGKSAEPACSGDVASVIEAMMEKRKNTIIVGECVASGESVVRGVMEKFERERGQHVSREVRSIEFISLPILSMKNLSREEMEQRLVELRGVIVKNSSYVGGGGVVLYLGDVQGVCELWLKYVDQRRSMMSYYCSLEHMVMELKKWVCGAGEVNKRVWILGVATFRTYMKCKVGQPSLENLWELHPLTVPAGSLSLTLNLDCEYLQSEGQSKEAKDGYASWSSIFENGGPKIDNKNSNLTCCTDCVLNFQKEIQSLQNKRDSINTSTSSNLPSWLQQYKNEKTMSDIVNFQNSVNVKNICKKWNSFCSAVHKHTHDYPEKVLKFYSTPSSPTSRSSPLYQSHLSWPTNLIEFKQSPKEHQFWSTAASEAHYDENDDCDVKIFVPVNDTKPDLLSNPNSSPNSASSSEVMEDMNDPDSFKEYNAENVKILTDALELKVPWQKDIVREIVNTILECRSGRRSNIHFREGNKKEETWMLFSGVDALAKEKIARELAKVIFGSHSNFISIRRPISCFSSPSSSSGAAQNHSTDREEHKSYKRPRSEMTDCTGYLQRFGEAVNENPHRVFFLEDLEKDDGFSHMGIKRAIESGKVRLSDGGGDQVVCLQDAIVILSCKSSSSMSRSAWSPPFKRQRTSNGGQEKGQEEGKDDGNEALITETVLDLNVAINEGGDQDDEKIIVGEYPADRVEIMNLVDKSIIFKIQELM